MSDKILSLDDLRKAMKILKEHLPCRCKPGTDFYCEKHGIMGISKEQQANIKEVFNQESKLAGDIKEYYGVKIIETNFIEQMEANNNGQKQ